jgi:hypothetical protein
VPEEKQERKIRYSTLAILTKVLYKPTTKQSGFAEI